MKNAPYCLPHTARVAQLKGWSKVIVCSAAIAAAFYFPWRITTFNPNALFLSLALYAAELFGLVSIVLHTFMTWRVLERQAPLPLPDATVDVFIPTYNEPVEMLRRTLMAARDMKYPHETWLLDDGHRPEMATLAAELGTHYLSRSDNKYAKAGNLNNALAHSSGDFIAIFDADHVPHEDYLIHTLGYFSDANVAFVQTPQDFYNLNSFQHRRQAEANVVWSEQSLFFRVIMPGKDYWNAAFFCGSCATTRRSAVESIGGFATETVTEDLHTSVRLHKKGYASVYHPESLAYGIAPDTFEPYESQRVRWGQGAMQVWRKERMVTSRGLTLPQRLCYLASVLTYFDGWQKVLMFLLPSFVLVTGIVPVASLDWNFALRFLPWYLLSLWACEELGRGYARSWTIEQYNFLRAPGFAFATLTFFLNKRLRFRVTKKGGSSSLENVKRLAPHLLVTAIGIGSLLGGSVRFVLAPHMTFEAMFLNVIWCLVTLAISVFSIRFALQHSKQERASYRFQLPVPVKIRDISGQPQLILVDDISSGGFSANVPQAISVDLAVELEADLILPSGAIPVRLKVRRSLSGPEQADQNGQRLAARFDWMSVNDGDALDRYLYGSNAEWRFLRLVDKGSTPSERIAAFVHRHVNSRAAERRKEWRAAITVRNDFNRAIEVLVSSNGGGDVDAVLAETIFKVGETIAVFQSGRKDIGYCKVVSQHIDKRAGRQMFLHRVTEVGTSWQGANAGQIWRNESILGRGESAA